MDDVIQVLLNYINEVDAVNLCLTCKAYVRFIPDIEFTSMYTWNRIKHLPFTKNFRSIRYIITNTDPIPEHIVDRIAEVTILYNGKGTVMIPDTIKCIKHYDALLLSDYDYRRMYPYQFRESVEFGSIDWYGITYLNICILSSDLRFIPNTVTHLTLNILSDEISWKDTIIFNPGVTHLEFTWNSHNNFHIPDTVVWLYINVLGIGHNLFYANIPANIQVFKIPHTYDSWMLEVRRNRMSTNIFLDRCAGVVKKIPEVEFTDIKIAGSVLASHLIN
jgi:hypothetical protein